VDADRLEARVFPLTPLTGTWLLMPTVGALAQRWHRSSGPAQQPHSRRPGRARRCGGSAGLSTIAHIDMDSERLDIASLTVVAGDAGTQLAARSASTPRGSAARSCPAQPLHAGDASVVSSPVAPGQHLRSACRILSWASRLATVSARAHEQSIGALLVLVNGSTARSHPASSRDHCRGARRISSPRGGEDHRPSQGGDDLLPLRATTSSSPTLAPVVGRSLVAGLGYPAAVGDARPSRR
jgi:hypothetical protein